MNNRRGKGLSETDTKMRIMTQKKHTHTHIQRIASNSLLHSFLKRHKKRYPSRVTGSDSKWIDKYRIKYNELNLLRCHCDSNAITYEWMDVRYLSRRAIYLFPVTRSATASSFLSFLFLFFSCSSYHAVNKLLVFRFWFLSCHFSF